MEGLATGRCMGGAWRAWPGYRAWVGSGERCGPKPSWRRGLGGAVALVGRGQADLGLGFQD